MVYTLGHTTLLTCHMKMSQCSLVVLCVCGTTTEPKITFEYWLVIVSGHVQFCPVKLNFDWLLHEHAGQCVRACSLMLLVRPSQPLQSTYCCSFAYQQSLTQISHLALQLSYDLLRSAHASQSNQDIPDILCQAQLATSQTWSELHSAS